MEKRNELMNFLKDIGEIEQESKLDEVLNEFVKGSIYNYYYRTYFKFYGNYEIDETPLTKNVTSVSTESEISFDFDLTVTIECKYIGLFIGRQGKDLNAITEQLEEDMKAVVKLISNKRMNLEIKFKEWDEWTNSLEVSNLLYNIKKGDYDKVEA